MGNLFRQANLNLALIFRYVYMAELLSRYTHPTLLQQAYTGPIWRLSRQNRILEDAEINFIIAQQLSGCGFCNVWFAKIKLEIEISTGSSSDQWRLGNPVVIKLNETITTS